MIMDQRTVLVTGATRGMGRATALAFARRQMTVVVHGRDPARVSTTVAEIVADTGNPRVHPAVADLSSQAEVRRLAVEVDALLPRLDVLVNNAAVIELTRTLSGDGVETTFAVNHLAPFLLTHAVLPTLRRSDDAHVVNAVAPVQRLVRIDLDDVAGERARYSGFRVNARSKLALLMFTYEAADRLRAEGVRVNAFEPGVVDTDLTRTFVRSAGPLGLLMRLRPRTSAEDAARIPLAVVTSEQFSGATGLLVNHALRPVPRAGQADDPQARRRLWEASAALTRLAERP
jgi:NAD(P)-dependent dehydrogenase (short-subunit alcohol dehydrogenase family)